MMSSLSLALALSSNMLMLMVMLMLMMLVKGFSLEQQQLITDSGSNNVIDYYTIIIRREIVPQLGGRITVNGTTPGPAIVTTLGNWLHVKVINEIEDDYTTVHWHGMTQVCI